MKAKSIKNEREYRRILKEIDSLMNAKANTLAGERLDLLASAAVAWEEKHYPICKAVSTHSQSRNSK
jgi:HTH-type transcriptional regulator / antitoxin HigA